MARNPVHGLVFGFSLPARAWALLLGTRRLKRYAVMPLVANALIYMVIIALLIWLLASLDLQVGPWAFWGSFGHWLERSINLLLGPLKWLLGIPVMMIFCFFTFTMIGMIVASPFNDILSERVERVVCEDTDSLSLPLMLTARAMVHGLFDSLKIVLWQLLFMVLTLPLLAIPFVGFIPLLLVNAYFTGLGFYDVSMARNMLRNHQKSPVVREHRSEVLGLGLCMYCLFLVPFVGLVMLPVGVTAGTLLYCDSEWERVLAKAGVTPPDTFRAPRPLRKKTASDKG